MQRIALDRFFHREPIALPRGRLIAYLVFSLFALTAFSCSQETVSAKDEVLFDFETDSDLNRFAWKCRSRFEISSEYSNTGKSSLRFEFHPAGRVGFSTGDVPHDWSIYKSFDFWVYNPSGSQVPLHLQVNRREPSGILNHLVARVVEIAPGPNKVSIPLGAGEEPGVAEGHWQGRWDLYFHAGDFRPTVLYFDAILLRKSL